MKIPPYTPSKKVKKGVLSKTATIKEYKENYADMNIAAAHAFALAKKANKPMLVIPGNSFGHAVLQIHTADNPVDAIRTVTAMLPKRGFTYVEVEPNGTVWE
jgi:hypothetical protein